MQTKPLAPFYVGGSTALRRRNGIPWDAPLRAVTREHTFFWVWISGAVHLLRYGIFREDFLS